MGRGKGLNEEGKVIFAAIFTHVLELQGDKIPHSPN